MANRPPPVVAVVDDDQRILESLESLLDSADYQVRVFPTPTAMLESDALFEIDCLISDVAMPVMDGFALARAVHVARPGLPIILMTGRSDLLQQSPLDWPGAHRVFKKPFDGEELLLAIADALR